MTTPLPSWRLKIQRAEHNFAEIEKEIRRYKRGHPYTAAAAFTSDGDVDTCVYRLQMTAQPNPMLAVQIGEFLFNLRSALDHVAVACSPRKHASSASFPIMTCDPQERKANGQYVVDEHQRAKYESQLSYLMPEAAAIIKFAQPFLQGRSAPRTALSVLSRLQNADKHRTLIVLATGVKNLSVNLVVRGGRMGSNVEPFREDGTEIMRFQIADCPPLSNDDIDMKIRGTATLALKIPNPSGTFDLPDSLATMLEDVSNIVWALELVARPRHSPAIPVNAVR